MLNLPLQIQAQSAHRVSPFYAGIQAGVPLFWGDLFSIGEKTRLGYGGGVALGYRPNNWLAIELAADYGVGKLGAEKWQVDDLIHDNGLIGYTNGQWKLGQLYSRTQFSRLSLRLPFSLLALLNPKKDRKFDIELGPQVSLDYFNPGLYDVATNRKLSNGTWPNGWSYATGGDIGLHMNLGNRTRIYFRSSLSWLSDERFEGVSSKPEWRVNLMNYNTLGIQLAIIK